MDLLDSDEWLQCPSCGEDYLHLESVESHTPKGNIHVTQRGSIVRKSNVTRSKADVSLIFWCEHCDPNTRFILCVANRKGNTHFTWFERKPDKTQTRLSE